MCWQEGVGGTDSRACSALTTLTFLSARTDKAHTRLTPVRTPGCALSPDPASAPPVANALGEPVTQGGTSSGSPVSALPLGTEDRRLSTKPLASAKGDAGTAKPKSKRLRPVPLDVETPHRSGDCTMDGRKPPVPCLPSSGSVCTQTDSHSVTRYLKRGCTQYTGRESE